jgi:hypothetical protein
MDQNSKLVRPSNVIICYITHIQTNNDWGLFKYILLRRTLIIFNTDLWETAASFYLHVLRPLDWDAL